MKKILFILIFLPVLCYSQISGKFIYKLDDNGVKSVEFKGTNLMDYGFYIRIYAVDVTNNSVYWDYYLGQNCFFTVGLNSGWKWEKGEKLYVQYPNGNSVYWVCDKSVSTSSTPSFTGSLQCKKCDCPTWRGGTSYSSHCPCGHTYAEHRRAGE